MATNSSLRQRVAAEVRAEMARRRVSQSELARRLGEGQPWVNRRVNGDVALDLDDLERISEALDAPITAFLGGWDQMSAYLTADSSLIAA